MTNTRTPAPLDMQLLRPLRAGLIMTMVLISLGYLTSLGLPNSLEMVMDPTSGKTLVWRDEFNNWSGDWSTRAVAHIEGQCARGSTRCARTRDGELILSVKEDIDNPGLFLAGHIGTQGRKEFDAYGYYEAKISFPALRGLLAGWWLAPTDDYIVNQSEVDIAECTGLATIHHTIWYRLAGMGAEQFVEPPPHISSDLGRNGEEANYHLYGVDWRPTGYYFYVDRQLVGFLASGLSSLSKFLVLSIKIPDYMKKDFDESRIQEYKMRVKYVRVWK